MFIPTEVFVYSIINMNNILTLMSYLFLRESNDDEIVSFIAKKPVIKPETVNFIQNVIHAYSNKQVNCLLIL